jgi:hypothetical protein
MAPKIEPNQIGQQRASDGGAKRHKPIHFAGANQSTSREQPRRGGQRNADLFDEDRREQYHGAMPNQKLKSFIHGSTSVIVRKMQFYGHRPCDRVIAAIMASSSGGPS